MSEQALVQNLRDAGCDSTTVQQFLAYGQAGEKQKQMHLLSVQRKHLLDAVHREEKRIVCLDYLVYQMEKAKQHAAGRPQEENQ